jgi:hypothetical protein
MHFWHPFPQTFLGYGSQTSLKYQYDTFMLYFCKLYDDLKHINLPEIFAELVLICKRNITNVTIKSSLEYPFSCSLEINRRADDPNLIM